MQKKLQTQDEIKKSLVGFIVSKVEFGDWVNDDGRDLPHRPGTVSSLTLYGRPMYGTSPVSIEFEVGEEVEDGLSIRYRD